MCYWTDLWQLKEPNGALHWFNYSTVPLEYMTRRFAPPNDCSGMCCSMECSCISLTSSPIFLFSFQSVIMLMFREEKSPDDEIKAWQFWHSRQHSVKQRILDAGKLQENVFVPVVVVTLYWEWAIKSVVNSARKYLLPLQTLAPP